MKSFLRIEAETVSTLGALGIGTESQGAGGRAIGVQAIPADVVRILNKDIISIA